MQLIEQIADSFNTGALDAITHPVSPFLAGPLPAAGRAVLRPSLHRAAQQWLENLAATAPSTLASQVQDPARGGIPSMI